jgi:hypothetical protein
MISRSLHLRSLLIAWIMGVALVLIPLATTIAGSAGSKYPQ